MLSSAEDVRSSARSALAHLEGLIFRHYGLTLTKQRRSDEPRKRGPRAVRRGPIELSHRAPTVGRAPAA